MSDTVPGGAAVRSNVPDDIMSVANEIYGTLGPVSLVWDDQTNVLTIWADPGVATSQFRDVVDAAGVGGDVVVKRSLYSSDELVAAARQIVDSGTLAGTEVSWAAPAPDHSGIDVGLVTTPRTRATTTVDGFPISTQVDGVAEAASRDLDTWPYKAGADIIRNLSVPNTYATCSSSFAVVNSSGTERILTANHCAQPAGARNWRVGLYQDSDDIGLQPLSVPSPVGVDDAIMLSGRDYMGAMYLGENTSNQAVYLAGSLAPIVGQYVHYSGAPSGTVYNNQITHTNLTVDYGSAGIYGDLARTVQSTGIPAAGNGDSGGPVFAVNADSYALASGVISGGTGMGNICHGDPATATRKCSDTLFFTPVLAYLPGTGFHILIE